MTSMETVRAESAALEGSLREMPLGDVLQLLDLGRKSGVLRVEDPRDGRAATIVVTDGRIAAADLHAVAAAGPTTMPNAPGPAHRRHVLDVVCDVLEWQTGRFAVAPLAAPLSPTMRRAAVGVDAILLEAAHRADEWARLADVVSGPDVAPVLLVLPAGEALALSPDEWRVVALADGATDLRTLATRLERDLLAVARDVHRLATIGVLAVAPAPSRSSAL